MSLSPCHGYPPWRGLVPLHRRRYRLRHLRQPRLVNRGGQGADSWEYLKLRRHWAELVVEAGRAGPAVCVRAVPLPSQPMFRDAVHGMNSGDDTALQTRFTARGQAGSPVADRGGDHGQASGLLAVADHVPDLETTDSPWQAHVA